MLCSPQDRGIGRHVDRHRDRDEVIEVHAEDAALRIDAADLALDGALGGAGVADLEAARLHGSTAQGAADADRIAKSDLFELHPVAAAVKLGTVIDGYRARLP